MQVVDLFFKVVFWYIDWVIKFFVLGNFEECVGVFYLYVYVVVIGIVKEEGVVVVNLYGRGDVWWISDKIGVLFFQEMFQLFVCVYYIVIVGCGLDISGMEMGKVLAWVVYVVYDFYLFVLLYWLQVVYEVGYVEVGVKGCQFCLRDMDIWLGYLIGVVVKKWDDGIQAIIVFFEVDEYQDMVIGRVGQALGQWRISYCSNGCLVEYYCFVVENVQVVQEGMVVLCLVVMFVGFVVFEGIVVVAFVCCFMVVIYGVVVLVVWNGLSELEFR